MDTSSNNESNEEINNINNVSIYTSQLSMESKTDDSTDKSIRKRIFEIIEPSVNSDVVSLIYDVSMIIAIVISIIPLAFKEEHKLFDIIDKVTVSIFIIDYILRYMTADYKLKNKSFVSFIKYPFTLWAIIDLLSILPSFLSMLNDGFKVVRIVRVIKPLKIIRIFKTFRYSNSILIIAEVIKHSKYPLMAVGTLSLLYILVSSLIIFNVEGDSFETFFDAVYWATVSLTTVGYGDIYPHTHEGRIVAMFSSLFGIALIALPSGIITAGYMDSINERNEKRKLKREKKKQVIRAASEEMLINDSIYSETIVADKDITSSYNINTLQ
ncbi:voltage-gated potassium channel [Piromyces finnis]|uniref:Voltage-gated potassium channel n=1 Tax=Piromyces finnis TaxID=1754191 RepID=A0A1Y1V8E2_9FUNG|nr:voltage-gated potassium channel [Piromyces finnis]|eukprot:ORX49630.1 voltage-gated potassium channel [Piromyces finnis]